MKNKNHKNQKLTIDEEWFATLHLQAESSEAGAASATATTTQETTTFTGVVGEHVGYAAVPDALAESDSVSATGLETFLSRPVRVATFSWAETDAVGLKTSISPWQLYFNDASIKYKLNNFAFIRCDLRIKILINASPFYYGWMKGCYQPLPNFTPTTISASSSKELIPYSHRPHVDIIPQQSQGGEMTLPFFYPRNWLRVGKSQDFADMGTLDFVIYAALASANGVTTQACTVQVFAWAENVTLSGPTLALSMQADEYGTGPVSGPASTVARLAGMVKGVPIIGKFATATEMGARAIGGIAKLFGFTNVPVIEPAQPYRQLPFPPMASPEIGYPVEKLTLDSKNELTIDPSAVGLPPDDELAIEKIVTKESYIATANWSTSDAVDVLMFSTKVTPFLFDNNGGTPNKLYLTPMALVASQFQNWRGDIIFTFKVVASKYHQGRVRIAFDPWSATVQSTADVGSSIYNTILDLSESHEAEVRIPFQQALGWLRIDSTTTTAGVPFGAGPFTIDDNAMNGIITLRVLTLLTAPVATSNCKILISARAADNLEFANPISYGTGLSMFPMQSNDVDPGTPVTDATELMQIKSDPQIYLDRYRINFGECVKSLRPLLRRSNYTETFNGISAGADDIVILYNRHSRFPLMYGYDPNGAHNAKGLTATGTTFPYNWVTQTPYNLIAPCFIGQKGAVHWFYNVTSPGTVDSMWVNRINKRSMQQVTTGQNSRGYGGLSANAFFWSTAPGSETSAGAAITNPKTQSGLAVSIPNYTQYKFESTNPTNLSTNDPTTAGYDGRNYEYVQVNIACYGQIEPKPEHVNVHKYFGVGTDFTLHFFLNVPTLYRYTGVPVPV
jgi:hypothetical protein